jgi:hypothetical protein
MSKSPVFIVPIRSWGQGLKRFWWAEEFEFGELGKWNVSF